MSEIFKVRSFESFNLYNAVGETALSSAELDGIKAYMRDYKALGNNTVSIGWGVPFDPATGKRAAGFTLNTAHEASFDEIRGLASYAKSIGLNVVLKPYAQTMGASGTNGSLPDNINMTSTASYPTFDPATFLKQWAVCIGQVASLAQEIGAMQIVIGTENQGFDTSAYRSLWQDIIGEARKNYSGLLTYDALYPLERGLGVDAVPFWDLLDVIGVSAYYPLTDKDNPAYSDVLAGWSANHIYPGDTGPTVNVVETLKKLSTTYGKPVQFTEFGAQSFHGVANSPAGSGPATKTADWQQQAWIYQSMFEAFSKENDTGWFNGVNSWGQSLVPGQDDSRFASYLATFGQTNFDIRGKDAGKVVAAWYGATNYLAYTDTSWAGSMANDRIALYGNQTGAASMQHQADTFGMTVSLAISGTIMNGKTPTVHFYINGTDYGTVTLNNVASGYVDSAGVSWTPQQSINFTLPATSAITELKVVMDSAVNVGGAENSQIFLASATVDGVALTKLTYTPASGSAEQQTVGAGGQWNGGYSVFDAAPWNTQFSSHTTGTAANPLQIDGGDGTDTAYVLGKASQYTISYQSGTNNLTLSESVGLNQNAVLKNTEFVDFADGSVLSVADRKFTTFAVNDSRASVQVVHKPDGSYSFTSKSGGATMIVSSAETLKFSDTTLSVDYTDTVQSLYVAYFGRAADSGGLANFQAQLAALGAPKDLPSLAAAYSSNSAIRSLVDAFGSSDESKALYTGDTSSFVTAIYNNVLNRGPDSEGLNFWVNAIDHGGLSRGNASLSIMSGALSNTSAQGQTDSALVKNKIAVASNFTFAIDTTAEAQAYGGNAAAAAVRSMLSGVMASTDASVFQATVEGTLSSLGSASSHAMHVEEQLAAGFVELTGVPDIALVML